MPMRIQHDLHTHTYLSVCCREKEAQRPALMIRLAEQMGLHTFGFSDHLWMHPAIPPSDFYASQGVTQIARLRDDLASIDTPLRILVGCEADMVAPGRFGITPEFAASLDYVLLACSHFHMREFVAQPDSAAPADVARHVLAFFRSAVDSRLATVIPHPFIPYGFKENYREILACIPDAAFIDAFGLAAEQGVGIEIHPGHLDPAPLQAAPDGSAGGMTSPSVRMLALAKQAGCRFTFGTDAHGPAAQRRLPELAQLAEAAGIGADDLLVDLIGAGDAGAMRLATA